MTPDALTEIATLEGQELPLQFTHFDNMDALALGQLFVEVAQQRNLPIVVDIRRFRQQLFHAALPGTTPENDSWIERKIRVVERFSESSYLVGRRLAGKGVALDEDLGVAPIDHAAHGGCVPIRVVGVGVVGTVTVSGLHQRDDHALVIELLARFLSTASSA